MSNCTNSINNQDLWCPPDTNWKNCRPWNISMDNINCLSVSIVDETLDIGGAPLRIYKLLGVHEQTLLSDNYRFGRAISGGDDPNFISANAFNKSRTSWRSKQRGAGIARSFIGYDFGEILLKNGRKRYGVEANKRIKVNSIKLKQSPDPNMRVLRVRVERSEDGKTWYGCTILDLHDSDELLTYTVPNSVPSRYWRLRPVNVELSNCTSWEVLAIEFLEEDRTDIKNIQDTVWLENRSRDYSTEPIEMKCMYSPVDTAMDLSKFGIKIEGLGGRYTVKVSLNQCIQLLGRPVVVGDIIELPSEAMLTHELTIQQTFLEVTSVGWDAASMTHGWQHTMLSLQASPALASEETQDIFGDKVPKIDDSGLSNIFDGTSTTFQDYADITQSIYADSNTDVPERGQDISGTYRQFDEDDMEKIKDKTWKYQAEVNLKSGRNVLYNEDAMPPNGLDYTEGPDFPDNPSDKDYHRLTYVGNSSGIPTKLYRYSSTKLKWVYLQTDRRQEMNNQRNILSEYLNNPNKVSPDKLGK